MKIIVKSSCFIKGKLLEPGKEGAPVDVSAEVAAAAIACGRAVKATKENTPAPKKPAKPAEGDK